jgi:hypothetical protein
MALGKKGTKSRALSVTRMKGNLTSWAFSNSILKNKVLSHEHLAHSVPSHVARILIF